MAPQVLRKILPKSHLLSSLFKVSVCSGCRHGEYPTHLQGHLVGDPYTQIRGFLFDRHSITESESIPISRPSM